MNINMREWENPFKAKKADQPNQTTTKPNPSYIMDDRNYYRQLTNHNLIQEAKYKPTAELSKVLAERLLAEMEKRRREMEE